MKTLKCIYFPLLVVFFCSPASAFIHFEPGIGYNRGALQSSKSQGIGLATKIGAEFSKFFLVADVGYHDLQVGSVSSGTATDMGLCIGGDFNSWRFWFTYLVAATLETPSGANTNEYAGDGMKLGMSGKLANDTYMNLEVRFIDFNELNSNATVQVMNVAFLSVSWKLF